MQSCNQQQVAKNVDDTGNQNKQKRWFAVPKTTENSSQKVIGYYEENAAATNTHIAGGQLKCLLWCLHKHRNGACESCHNYEQCSWNYSKYNCSTSNYRTNLFRFLFAKITGNENGNSHCKLRYYKGDQIQYLASGGNRGKSGGGAKAAYYQKVYSTVSGLQYQCTQNRKHK